MIQLPNILVAVMIGLVVTTSLAVAVQDSNQPTITSTTNSTTKKLFTYTGPLLPSDWTLVSLLNDRAVIGFTNGSARNAALEELDLKDRVLLQKLQNGTLYATPLQGAKEKLAQWSSQVSSTVTKLGKSVREQFDSLINKKDKDGLPITSGNFTSTTTTIVN